jgi:hypothetical protein
VIGEPGNPERLLGFYFRDGIIVLVPVLVLVYVKRVPLRCGRVRSPGKPDQWTVG